MFPSEPAIENSRTGEFANRPAAVTHAVYLLVGAFAFAMAKSVPEIQALGTLAVAVTSAVCVLVLVFIYKIWTQRNWARITFSALFVLGLFRSVPQLFVTYHASPTMGLVDAMLVAAQALAVAFLFLPGSNAWFRRNGV